MKMGCIIAISLYPFIQFMLGILGLCFVGLFFEDFGKAILSTIYIFVFSLTTFCLFYYLYKKQELNWFVGITTIIGGLLAYIYMSGAIVVFGMFGETLLDETLTYLSAFVILFLPLPLAIYAYTHKNAVETIFHLGYMLLAPIVAFLSLDSVVVFILILSIPFLFLLKNLYLCYRRSKTKDCIIFPLLIILSLCFIPILCLPLLFLFKKFYPLSRSHQ